MARVGNDKSIHKKMVRGLAQELKNEGYTVKAAHIEGYKDPEMVNGYIPDIIATGDSRPIIVKAETCESYDDEHTREQIEAFRKANNAQLHVIVPKECAKKVNTQVHEWGIVVDEWWIYNKEGIKQENHHPLQYKCKLR